MEAKAILRHARISPTKVAPALDLIRGKNADVAMGILRNSRRGANEYLVKLLASAIARGTSPTGLWLFLPKPPSTENRPLCFRKEGYFCEKIQ